MSTYVLVHGAWHGAWAWHKVVPRLEAAGHDVITLDLPAHGRDQTPLDEVSLADYVTAVGEVIAAQSEPVVLVGHSFGGVVITQTAEAYPDQIDTLVYLSAFLLDDGETLLEYAEADTDSVVTRNLEVAEEAGYAVVADEAVEEAFYADCSAADVTLARSLLRREPLVGFVTPVSTSAERFGGVRRVYLGCERDRAITPATQQAMRDTLPPDEVRQLDTSHSPFLSAPETLVDHLQAVVDGDHT